MTTRRLVIPGGTGHLGRFVASHFAARGYDVVVLSRGTSTVPGARVVRWDGRTSGPWTAELDGAAAVLNLAGRSVGCRYDKSNLTEMYASRIDSTRAVATAIGKATNPPPTLLQMSTATIYAHRFDGANDEHTGIIGGHEPDAPGYWRFSVEIADRWEQEAQQAPCRVTCLRTAIVMSPEPGGAFHRLRQLVKLGAGGAIAGGRQYVSWIHEADFIGAVEFLLAHDITGPVNLAAPNPLPNAEFMAVLRAATGTRFGIPATRWQTELGSQLMGADAELVLKSRRVVPTRLLEAGFTFEHPDWPEAARDLIRRGSQRPRGSLPRL